VATDDGRGVGTIIGAADDGLRVATTVGAANDGRGVGTTVSMDGRADGSDEEINEGFMEGDCEEADDGED